MKVSSVKQVISFNVIPILSELSKKAWNAQHAHL